MQAYLNLIKEVLDLGEEKENRTGINTIGLEGAMVRFNLLDDSFPAVTTKKLAFKSVVAEACAFMRASSSAADFRALGSKVWDQNANENAAWLANPYRKGEDDLGPVYGVQWRKWPGFKAFATFPTPEVIAQLAADGWQYRGWMTGGEGADDFIWTKEIDQLADCIDKIVNDPGNRRILFHGWNPAVLDQVALPACHLLYQFMPNVVKKTLSMVLYVRSWDVGLGAPFNIAEAAVILKLIAHLTGYQAKTLTIMGGDVHIYKNHVDELTDQTTRQPFQAPRLDIALHVPYGLTDVKEIVEWLSKVEPSDFRLIDYTHHDGVRMDMAV